MRWSVLKSGCCRVALLAAVLMWLGRAGAAEADQAMQLRFAIRWCVIRDVRLNDLPVADEAEGGLVTVVNGLTVNGTNTLTFGVAPKDAGKALDTDASIEVRLGREPSEAEFRSRVALPSRLVGTWQAAKPADAAPGPAAVRMEFTSEGVPEPWAWQRGEVLSVLGDADRAALAGIAQRLLATLAWHDMDGLLALLRTKDAEFARAFGKPARMMDAETRRFFREEVFGTDWAWAPVDPPDVMFRQIAGNRAVQLGSRSRTELIRGTAGGGKVFSITLILARIDGEWVIVR